MNMVGSPDWTTLTETKWVWFDEAKCPHIVNSNTVIASLAFIADRISHKAVISHQLHAAAIKISIYIYITLAATYMVT